MAFPGELSWSEQEEKATAHSWSWGERADLGDQQGRSSLTVTEGRQPGRRGARVHGHSLEGFCFLRAIGSKVISSERAGGGGVGHLRGEGTVYRRAG